LEQLTKAGRNIPNDHKNTGGPLNIPNGHIPNTPNGQKNIQTFSVYGLSKIYKKCYFWFAKIPSGNIGLRHTLLGDIFFHFILFKTHLKLLCLIPTYPRYLFRKIKSEPRCSQLSSN
jgi:hypothetical protein